MAARSRAAGGGGGSSQAPATTVFALVRHATSRSVITRGLVLTITLSLYVLPQRKLAALEWRVYGADPSGAAAADRADPELAALFARLQAQQLLTVRDEEKRAVWLFVVNNGGHDFPTADTLGDLIEVDSGAWTRGGERPLGAQLTRRLFRALHAQLTRRLLRHADFEEVAGGGERFRTTDAAFEYSSPSLSLLNHWDMYLLETLPAPVFQLHFQLFVPAHLLCVSVAMAVEDAALPAAADEPGDPQAAWQRLLGLPRAADHSMIDVWHLDDGLVPRMVAETKFADVFPRFRAVAKRRHKRKSGDDGGDANEGDDGKKTDENDEDGDDDEDDATHSAEGDGDGELLRRAAPGKKKRKKANTDPAENDESVAPVSPDTHVNTPEASGPTVLVTFPRDPESTVHYGTQVNHFKRRRNPQRSKKKSGAELALVFSGAAGGSAANGSTATDSSAATVSRRSSALDSASFGRSALSTPPHASMQERRSSLFGSAPPSAVPRVDTKPTLSVAVSLVASLSHDEQQEALDGRPTKPHPLLEALRSYVEQELSSSVDARSRQVGSCKNLLLPSADDYVPSVPRRTPSLLSTNRVTLERLRNNLLSDRFKPWISDYSPHQYLKRNKQCRKEHQRKLLLEFDSSKLAEYTQQRMGELVSKDDVFKTRDEEIAIGVQVAASDALVVWRQASDRWSQQRRRGTRAATPREKQALADRVQPYLLSLRSSLAKVGEEANSAWLSFGEYARQASAGEMDSKATSEYVPDPPKFSVASADVGFHVEPPLISEYLLRGFHPVAAPKPVDYAIVCPHSPSEWLGTLALSYLTCFRSMYAQCHMGDHASIDLSQVEPTRSVSVDASNALLLVECASSAYDAFATYRSAGELLQPVLSSGVKKKQAFSRSAVANVIYVVVPFRRQDVKHKMWAVGAFSRGLFGPTPLDAPWRNSVTLELLYLEDLYDVCVNPNPFVLMPSCFGVYDRVFENVSLKPAGNDLVAAAPQGGRSRFISERLYHLAEPKAEDRSAPCVYGAYVVSEDRKWVACSCVDAVGSLLETHMISLNGVELEDALLSMMAKWLDFLALFGEKARLVICRLAAGDESLNDAAEDEELSAWRTLSATREAAFVPAAFAPLVADVTLLDVRFAQTPAVQLQEDSVPLICEFANAGYLVVPATDGTGEASRGACLAAGGGCNTGLSALSRSFTAGTQEPAVVKVSVAIDDLLPKPTSDSSAGAGRMAQILRDFYALSYLTMHPVTATRASPLPLHLAAVDRLRQDMRTLARQLRTDPLEQSC